MGLVTFSTDSLSQEPGVRVDEKVIPLSDLDEISATSTTECLEEISVAESEAREQVERGDETYADDEVEFHRPLEPGKIIRLEGCYEHDLTDEGFNPLLEADGLNEMDWPSHLAVPPCATVSPGGQIELPEFAETVRAGAELAFVVGREAKYLDPSNGLDAIAGCLLTADIAIYDELPGLFGYKFFDSALPLGREITSTASLNVNDIELKLAINNETVDSRTTAEWRFTPGELIASVSEIMTVNPGDLILTGDPVRTNRTLEADDEVSIAAGAVGTGKWTVTREEKHGGIRI